MEHIARGGNIANTQHEYCQHTTRILTTHNTNIANTQHEYCQHTTRILPTHNTNIDNAQHEYCQHTTRIFSSVPTETLQPASSLMYCMSYGTSHRKRSDTIVSALFSLFRRFRIKFGQKFLEVVCSDWRIGSNGSPLMKDKVNLRGRFF